MKLKLSKETYPFYLIALFGLALLTYTSVRAGILSFTHDESNTFLRHVPESFMQIVSYHQPKANNHILNTLFIKLFLKVFPDTDFFIRLPNLIAHGIYIFFSILILKRFRNPVIIIGGFILINFNPYMLDFFSLARGYGLALSLVMATMLMFLIFIESNKIKYIYWYYIFAAFAVLSHFVLLHFYVSAIVVYNLLFIKEFRSEKYTARYKLKKFFHKNIPALIVSSALTIILFEPIRKLSKFNELYGHGNNSFFKDTIISFVNGTTYSQNYGTHFVKFAAISLFVFITLLLFVSFFDLKIKKFDFRKSKLSIFTFLLIMPAISSVLQHYILGDQYLSYRLTLFFVPLLGLAIITFVFFLINNRLRILGLGFLIIFSGILFIHQLNAINFTHFSEWKYDANTKNMILELEKEFTAEAEKNTIKLGIKWLFEPTINFYRETRNLDWLERVNREGIDGDYDYYYILKEQLPVLNNERNVAIIKEYDISNTLFLERK